MPRYQENALTPQLRVIARRGESLLQAVDELLDSPRLRADVESPEVIDVLADVAEALDALLGLLALEEE